MYTLKLPSHRKRTFPPTLAGILGAGFLAGIYLGIVSIAESPNHALELFWQDRGFVIPILIGFGVQVGLYTFLKTGLFLPAHSPVGGASTAAGGGTSGLAMVACCAHHVVDVLPLIGLSAAAAFFAAWKIPFLIAGISTNMIGIALMLYAIRKERQRVIIQPVFQFVEVG